MLYGLMLDRMCLSLKNHWIDREKRVYIVFTLEQVTEYLNCGRDKGMKILAELDSKKGIGLIERVKQGFGKPDAIYVKNFIVKQNEQPEQETAETPEDRNQSAKPERVNLSRPESPTYRGRKNRPGEVGKIDLPGSGKSTCTGRKNRP